MPTDREDKPSWLDDPDYWDALSLGGDDLPGIWKVDGAEVGRKIQTHRPRGRNGGRVIDTGIDLAKFKAQGLFWTSEHWTAWEDLVEKLLPRRKLDARAAIVIEHPDTATLGIHTVYVEKVSQLKDGQFWGSKTVTISLVEYVPQPKKKGNGSVTKGAAQGPEVFTIADINEAISRQVVGQNEEFIRHALNGAFDGTRASASGPRATGAADPYE